MGKRRKGVCGDALGINQDDQGLECIGTRRGVMHYREHLLRFDGVTGRNGGRTKDATRTGMINTTKMVTGQPSHRGKRNTRFRSKYLSERRWYTSKAIGIQVETSWCTTDELTIALNAVPSVLSAENNP